MSKRAEYEAVKAAILEAVGAIRAEAGDDAADYLLEHLHMDDKAMTFRYDGEPGRLTIAPFGPPGPHVTLYPKAGSLCPHCEGGPLLMMHSPNYQADMVCNLCGWTPSQRPDMGIEPEPGDYGEGDSCGRD